MTPAAFEPAIPASQRPPDPCLRPREATWTGTFCIHVGYVFTEVYILDYIFKCVVIYLVYEWILNN